VSAPEEDLVRYRLERAWETLEEAGIMAESNRWNTCVNRLYFACFYAVSALLLRHGLSSSKHGGLRSLFNQRFVATGRFPKELARVYNDLFERRQQGDYIDLFRFDESRVRPWIPRATEFVRRIATMLDESATGDAI